MQIYLARNNQQAGPYTVEQINQMLASQQVLLTDLAWHQGMAEWKALGELTQGKLEYQPTGYVPSAPFPTQTQTSETSSATPAHTIQVNKKQGLTELAPFYARFLAKLIDVLFWLPITYILTAFFSEAQQAKFIALNEQLLNLVMSKNPDEKLMMAIQSEIVSSIPMNAIMSAAAYIVIMLSVQAYLLHKNGQSIGKRLLGIQIVDYASESNPGVVRAFVLRSLVFIPPSIYTLPLFSIVDYLFTLGKKRQTLHDKLAKTKVIKRPK